MEKIIDIIRDKNINLNGIHLYFSTGTNFKKIFFLEFSEIFFN
jgi:hypothetical protein